MGGNMWPLPRGVARKIMHFTFFANARCTLCFKLRLPGIQYIWRMAPGLAVELQSQWLKHEIRNFKGNCQWGLQGNCIAVWVCNNYETTGTVRSLCFAVQVPYFLLYILPSFRPHSSWCLFYLNDKYYGSETGKKLTALNDLTIKRSYQRYSAAQIVWRLAFHIMCIIL